MLRNQNCQNYLMFFYQTRSYAALRAADQDWIVGQGYSSGGYILEKNHEKPTWNHKNYGKPTWNHEKPTWNYENRPGTMKNQPGTIKKT